MTVNSAIEINTPTETHKTKPYLPFFCFLKCLTIAEIETYLTHQNIIKANKNIWNFQKFIGFGFLNLD